MTTQGLQTSLRPAASDMERQLESGTVTTGYYNISSMWRASGEPARKDPNTWRVIAKPLIEGMAGYVQNLGLLGTDVEAEVIFVLGSKEDLVDDSDQVGDVMATFLLAHAYAFYLDADPAE